MIVAKEVTRGTEYKTLPAEKIPASWHIVDVGKKTLDLMAEALEPARTVFWNGPLGVFEIPVFGAGTRAMARLLADKAEAGATVVVGGGDSVAAVQQQDLASQDDPHLDGRRRVARIPRRAASCPASPSCSTGPPRPSPTGTERHPNPWRPRRATSRGTAAS